MTHIKLFGFLYEFIYEIIIQYVQSIDKIQKYLYMNTLTFSYEREKKNGFEPVNCLHSNKRLNTLP